MDKSEAGKLGFQKSKIALEAKYTQRRTNYLASPNFCFWCKTTLEYERRKNKFCSHTCAALFSNRDKLSKEITPNCKFCKNLVVRNRSSRWNKYCRDCINNKVYLNRLTDLTLLKCDDARKKFIIKECGRACQVCKNTTWNGQEIPIELDHIDGNSSNNTRSNLRLICPNCHAQTPTYKGRNIGMGRFKRKLRFNQDKSY